MQAPPSRASCIFGPACTSQEGGKAEGPYLCEYCKNISLYDLYEFADHAPDFRAVRAVVEAYQNHLRDDMQQRLRSRLPLPCAIKDLGMKHHEWRKGFNPQDDASCKLVTHQGQLCSRCFAKAKEQQCKWLETEFDGDRHRFPCVFEDRRLHRMKDYEWRRGPGEDKDWEKDPKRHIRCGRRDQRFQLCQNCFNRMNEMRGFSHYFDPTHGILVDRYKR